MVSLNATFFSRQTLSASVRPKPNEHDTNRNVKKNNLKNKTTMKKIAIATAFTMLTAENPAPNELIKQS